MIVDRLRPYNPCSRFWDTGRNNYITMRLALYHLKLTDIPK